MPQQRCSGPLYCSLVMLAFSFHDLAVQHALGMSEMLYGIKHEDSRYHQPYAIHDNKVKPEIKGVA